MTHTYAALTQEHFARRRDRLMQELPGGAIILAAGHDANRNHDVDYEFRQQSAFWYFTGFGEPDAVAVLRPGHQEPYVLFVRPYDPKFEIWVGFRAGVEGVLRDYEASAAYSIDQLKEELPKLLEDYDTVYFSLGSDSHLDELLTDVIKERRAVMQRGSKPVLSVVDPRPVMDEMRLVKTDDEIALMQQAIDITGQGFNAAVRTARPGVYEYQVQAEMEAQFRRMGSPRNGYPSIVASGSNSCILHYIRNRGQIQDGNLLLIDAGAEFEYYTADVTRTWPINGRFSPEQRAVYDVVLEAQRQGINTVVPEAGFNQVHQACLRVLIQGLKDFGILEGEIDGLIEQDAYRPYYMHSTSHWLGLDVHDAGRYRHDKITTPLRSGMVLTVEPGLYFGPQATDTPERLRGIGIRIEDDVLVTQHGHRVLSASIPKQVAELEALASQGNS